MKVSFFHPKNRETFYAFVSRFAVQDKATLQMFYDYFVCRFFRGRLKKSKWLQKTHFFGNFVVDNV